MHTSPSFSSSPDRRQTHPVMALALALALCGWGACFGVLRPGSAGAATEHKRPVCVQYRCKTIAADAQVRVYQATSRHPGRETHERTYAQWLPTGRVTALGDNGAGFEGAVLGRLAVAGRFVAYALGLSAERYAGSGTTWGVVRLNAQTGHRESVAPDGEKGGGFGEKSPGVTGVVATPAGSVAWVDDGSLPDPLPPPPGSPGGPFPWGPRRYSTLLRGPRRPVRSRWHRQSIRTRSQRSLGICTGRMPERHARSSSPDAPRSLTPTLGVTSAVQFMAVGVN